MPYSIESFAYVSEYHTNFLIVVKCFTEDMIQVNQLMSGTVFGHKSRLHFVNQVIIAKVNKQIFEYTFF